MSYVMSLLKPTEDDILHERQKKFGQLKVYLINNSQVQTSASY
jgi:hypothetical protein